MQNQLDDQLDENGHNVSAKCAVYVAVTAVPYHYNKGPTRNTVYPASWAVCSLPENYDTFDVMEEFIEGRASAFVALCSNANPVGWKKIGATQIGGVAYDAQFSAVCTNPFTMKDTWYVNAWLKKLQSDNIEEELHFLPCSII